MRRILQIILVVAGSLVALFGLLVALVFASTSALVGAADGFLAAVRAQDLAGAVRLASAAFQASTSEEALRAFLDDNGISRIRAARWSSRNRESGGRGTLDGVVETEDGRSVPLQVILVKEGEAWRVHGLARPAAGLLDLGAEGLPAPAEQVALLRGSVRALADAVRSEDFEAFRAGVARLWQAQATADYFRKAFSGAASAPLLVPLEPELDGASAEAGGVIAISGHYQLAGGRAYLRAKYVREGLAWKLLGLDVDTKPLDP